MQKGGPGPTVHDRFVRAGAGILGRLLYTAVVFHVARNTSCLKFPGDVPCTLPTVEAGDHCLVFVVVPTADSGAR